MRYRAPLIGVLAALVLAVGFYFLLYQPRNRDLEEIRDETAQLEIDRDRLTGEVARLREIESRELEFRAALARLEEYIPTGIAQSALIRHFQLAADESGVAIDVVTFGDPQPVEEASPTGVPETVLGAIPVSMTVEGGYFQMVDFMRRVEVEVPRAVLVRSLSVVEGPDEFPQLASTWNGQLFAVIPDTEPAEPDEEAGEAEEAPGEDGSEADPDADDGDDVDATDAAAEDAEDAGDVS